MSRSWWSCHVSAQSSYAQIETVPNIPADSFRPALDANGFLDVEWGYVSGAKAVDAALFIGHSLNPLVLGYRDGSTAAVRQAVLVGNRLGLTSQHLMASTIGCRWVSTCRWYFFKTAARLTTISLVPLPPHHWPLPGLATSSSNPKSKPSQETFGVDMALVTTVTIPTNTPEAGYLGEESFTFVPEMAFGKDFGDVRLLSNIGGRLRNQDITAGGLVLSHEFLFRLALAYALPDMPLEIGELLYPTVALTDIFANSNQNPLEVLAGAQYHLSDKIRIDGGLGMGIVAGYGAPDARLFAGMRYVNHKQDRDGDGIADADDACPDEPEDIDEHLDAEGCPIPITMKMRF